jgi:hypothetical protein
MRRFVAAVVGVLTCGLPLAARAEGAKRPNVWHDVDPMPVEQGVQVGARLGFAAPSGNLYSGSARMSDLDSATVPIGIDLGYRLSPGTYLGVTVAWGAGLSGLSTTCPPPASCFKDDSQIRFEVREYLAPHGKVGWWIGAGAGWELFGFGRTVGDSTTTATFQGPVFADVQLGVDFRKGMFAAGPYVGMTIGEFTTEALDPAPGGEPGISPSVHVWLSLGMRVSYGPW